MVFPDRSQPRTPNVVSIGSGTAYSLTAVSAAVAPGTTTPLVTLPEAGRWRLTAEVVLKNNAATFAASRTVTLKLRRTNNTAADLTDGTRTFDTPVITTQTQTFISHIWACDYDTLLTNDTVTLFADVSVVPSAGSLDVSYVKVTAEKVVVGV